MEDWAEIRRPRRAEKMSISEIARVLQISRNTVPGALGSDGPPKYERTPAGSIVDAVELRVRGLLKAYPTMPATVIAERIGWSRSIRALSARVAELRPAYRRRTRRVARPTSRARSCKSDTWFPPITLPVGFGQTRKPTQLPVLTMVTGYSRWLSGLRVPTRSAQDLDDSRSIAPLTGSEHARSLRSQLLLLRGSVPERLNPSSGYVVRVEHLPDRTYRLWLQRPSGAVDLGRSMRTHHLYPDTHARTAAYFGVAPADLGAVELITPTPPYYRKHQAVLTTDDDGRRLPAYVVGYVQGGFHLDTPEGIGIYPPERIDFNPSPEAMTYRGRHGD